MRKSFFHGSIIGLIGWIVLWGIFFGLDPVPVKINSNVRNAFNATCKVSVGPSKGTGVLLNTGYVITAAHVVDHNKNGKIEDSERHIELEFYGEHYDVEAEIFFIGRINHSDFAILKPIEPIYSDIYLSKNSLKYGDRVFTIGMTRGFGPLITEGFQSWDSRVPTRRVSVFVHEGNSGGGIFNEHQVLHGIVSQTISSRQFAPVRVRITRKHKGKIYTKFAYGDAMVWQHMSAWCEYVDSGVIRKTLNNKGILFLVERSPKKININWFYVQMVLQILGVLSCVIWFRKDFFG